MVKIKVIMKCLTFFSLIIILVGCSRTSKSVSKEKGTEIKENSNRKEALLENYSEEYENENLSYQEKISIDDLNKIIKKLQGKESVADVDVVSEDTIMLAIGNRDRIKCSFLDLSTGKVVAQLDDNCLVAPFDCYLYKNSIVIMDSSSHIFILDTSYRLIKTIDVNSIEGISDYSLRNYCYLPSKDLIIYFKDVIEDNACFNVLYSINSDGTDEKELLRLESPETNLNFVNGFNQIVTSSDEKSIYYTGFYCDNLVQGVQAKECYGQINLDTLEIENYKSNKPCILLLTKGALFHENVQDKAEKATGKIMILDRSNNIEGIDCISRKESQYVYADQFSQYIYTYDIEKSDVNGEIQQRKVSKYSLENGSLEGTQIIDSNYNHVVICEKLDLGIQLVYNQNSMMVDVDLFSIKDMQMEK